MVRKIIQENKNYYLCEECKHYYETEELAQECENFCREHKACNILIVQKSKGRLEEREEKSKISQIVTFLIGILIGFLAVYAFVLTKIPTRNLVQQSQQSISENEIQNLINQVLPREGVKTKLVFGDAVKKMIDCGVIDIEKMQKLYNGQIPEYLQKLINGSNEEIVINQETASYLLNIFWPLGLSNKTEFNKSIPFSQKELPYLASTGGWWLGKKENGAEYFNKCEIVQLTKEQENLVYQVAQNTFRPCCNNSTFAQDCNHGSALLGALELAASQEYNEDELYRLALTLNSFWFPQNYIETAIYFKYFENKDWSEVDPKLVMSSNFSSISGWLENVHKKVAQLKIPQVQQGGSCGLQ